MSETTKVRVYAATIAGNTNIINKDNIYYNGHYITTEEKKPDAYYDKVFEEEIQVLAICDGEGATDRGAVPSTAVMNLLSSLQEDLTSQNGDGAIEQIEEFIADTNKKILIYKETINNEEISTTFSGAFIFNNQLITANIGDSRVYIFNKDNGLIQITKDHLESREMLELGVLQEEQASIHSSKSHLTKYFGQYDKEVNLKADFSQPYMLTKDDLIILTTDGITDYIDHHNLNDIIQQNIEKDQSELAKIILDSVESNSKDDRSIIIAKVEYLPDVKSKGKVLSMSNNNTSKDSNTLKEYLPKIIGVVAGTFLVLCIGLFFMKSLFGDKPAAVATKPNIQQEQQESNKKPTDEKQEQTQVEKQDNSQEVKDETPSSTETDTNTSDTQNNQPSNDDKEETKPQTSDNKDNTNTNDNTGKIVRYTIKKGDNLYRIALDQYGTGAKAVTNALAKYNGIDDQRNVKVGDTISLPALSVLTNGESSASTTATTSTTIESNDGKTYKVAKGDTLYSISRKFYGDSKHVQAIQDYNDLKTPQDLKSGMTIKLP